MQSNEFDGNAAFSGGGFMPSQATQTAPDRPSSSSKNSDARCLLPLTVKQLMDLSRGGESDISIEGVDVNNIVLVGRVSKIDNAVSECTFRVDDGTGWVECTKWVHEHIDSVEVDAISVGMYVRVYGQLKSIHGRRTVHTFSIRLVTDYNEITNHFIECIYVHLYNTKMRGCINTQPRMTNSVGGMTAQPQVANSNFGNPGKGYSYETNQYNNDEEQIHALSSTVLQFLRRPASIASEMGVSSVVIARELNDSEDKVRQTLEFLASEGLVYTTTEDYYKFTDA
ncbi:Replication protein A, subunit RPA32, putative isoform 4 [Hibiscus syriacus]|uniref:Replication protein A, subunit RPA32, putative isoform 4 n=1 Tax=Hibiscus syriacus TaxID=106335 RepID=A0A6A3AAG4_HIBSY|nr:replication protein A 32 kDa subunit B-like isoform X1 [Hibiscus syriacus]XP_039005030.1 replication protein A 32 kDa subunit B-like isoform X1 [Hibiscus syriacus]KAE8700135.1 Replication protein A, subunit RPA32, putative isoform 4 [Hibiscus syriacus]KAE8700137.1 Replication protein A, subunit RPA32, putative isoform 4 [Hibiscus syriacus]